MEYASSLKLKSRYNYTLDTFSGIDLTHDDAHISPTRASSAENFFTKGRVMHKRNGWRELAAFEGRINGIFNFTQESKEVLVIHAGCSFYLCKLSQNTISERSEIAYGKNINKSLLRDTRSMAFRMNEKLYIIGCGDFLVYGKFSDSTGYELRRVYNNTDTYIPTTTVGIENTSVKEQTPSFFENVNLLSPYIKNLIFGCETVGNTWKLDCGKIKKDSKFKLEASVLSEQNDDVRIDEYVIESGEGCPDKLYFISKNGVGIDYPEYNDNQCGTLNREEGSFSLTIPTTPFSNAPNITATFQPDYTDSSQQITLCEIGTLYGVNGKPDRLFVGGNPAHPNIDFYSEQSDPSYFPDVNSTAFGNEHSAIVCYLTLNDGTLAVMKSKGDSSGIYYRTGEYQYSQDGKVCGSIFSVKAAIAGETPVSPFCALNFCADNVFLSDNGLFGIERQENSYTDIRYARERSTMIRNAIRSISDKSKASAAVHNGVLYLSLSDEDDKCYATTYSSKFISDETASGSFDYEWWLFSNIPARVWGKIGNSLAFGSKEGKVCVFENDYCDRTLIQINEGDVTPDIVNNRLTYNSSLELEENDTVILKNSRLSLCVASFWVEPPENAERDENGNLPCLSDENGADIFRFVDGLNNDSSGVNYSVLREGKEVFVEYGQISFSGLTPEIPYYISDIDRGKNTFKLKNSDGSYVKSVPWGIYPSSPCQLTVPLDNREVYICDVEKSSFKLKESKNSKPISFSYSSLPDDIVVGKIIKSKPVRAFWVTPITDLGTNDKSKTLLKMTLFAQSNDGGCVKFGYETRQINKSSYASKGISSLDMDKLSFNDLTFETGFSSSFSVNVNERNFNFVRFRLMSEDEYDCTVNSLSVKYKIGKNNIGIN